MFRAYNPKPYNLQLSGFRDPGLEVIWFGAYRGLNLESFWSAMGLGVWGFGFRVCAEFRELAKQALREPRKRCPQF